jgi:hypothetical protein
MKVGRAVGLASFLGALALASPAEAAPPWVDRGITLPRFGLSLDAGLGIAHFSVPDPAAHSPTGAGLNLEGAFGITSNLEIGLRTGVRLGDDAKFLQADRYGRLFDTETYGTGVDTFANPEFHIRGRLINVHILELGLEGRAYLPFETGTRFGVMFGVPVALHFGGTVRLDTGVYVPVIFYNNTATVVSIPGRLWIQATDRFWLGPITAIHIYSGPPLVPFSRNDADVLIGFGLGYQISRFADFKTQLIFPRINGDAAARLFGFGVGIGLNFD